MSCLKKIFDFFSAAQENRSVHDLQRENDQLKMEIERLKEYQNKVEAVQKELLCGICYEMCVDAISLNCTHIFCEECINTWKRLKQECPACRSDTVHESRARILDNIIGIFRPPPTLTSNAPSGAPVTPVRPPPPIMPNAPRIRHEQFSRRQDSPILISPLRLDFEID